MKPPNSSNIRKSFDAIKFKAKNTSDQGKARCCAALSSSSSSSSEEQNDANAAHIVQQQLYACRQLVKWCQSWCTLAVVLLAALLALQMRCVSVSCTGATFILAATTASRQISTSRCCALKHNPTQNLPHVHLQPPVAAACAGCAPSSRREASQSDCRSTWMAAGQGRYCTSAAGPASRLEGMCSAAGATRGHGACA